MEVMFVVLVGGGMGAAVVFAWAKWLRKAEERDEEQRREEVQQAENSLTERLGASPKKPN
jgi:type II secretory pathway pseudopilin PulG